MIYLFIAGEEKGPFTRAEVRLKLRSRQCTPETLAWKEGMSDWAPICAIVNLSGPPPIRRSPPPPPPVAIPSPSLAEEATATGSAGHVIGGFLFPVLAFVLWSVGGGFLALILAVIGGYNAWCAYRLAKLFGRGKGIAVGGLAFNILAFILTVLILGSLPPQPYNSGNRALYAPSIAAWNVLITAMESARNAPAGASISSTLTAEISAIDAIDDRGVDSDLSSLIHRRRELLQRELQITSLIDSEARSVNDNAQVGSAFLALIFGAAGAQNDIDSWRGASRVQQAGAELADGIRLSQLQAILRQHESEIVGLKNEESSLGAELIQLEQKLRFRYPGFFGGN